MHTNPFCVIIHKRVIHRTFINILEIYTANIIPEVNSFVEGTFFFYSSVGIPRAYSYELEMDWKSIQFSINFFVKCLLETKTNRNGKSFFMFHNVWPNIFMCFDGKSFPFFFCKRKQIEKASCSAMDFFYIQKFKISKVFLWWNVGVFFCIKGLRKSEIIVSSIWISNYITDMNFEYIL